MELELVLAPPNNHLIQHSDLNSTSVSCKKRGFCEAFEKTTLPLFVRENDDGVSKKKKVVGWPPVRRACAANYVKVKKEGVAIGRKVDLSLHGSYEELLATLDHMFPATNIQDDNEIRNSDYVVVYEDGDGDWMLVGDVPWDAFARSVKRLKILG